MPMNSTIADDVRSVTSTAPSTVDPSEQQQTPQLTSLKPKQRTTNIQVCIRLRPILPADYQIQNNIPPTLNRTSRSSSITSQTSHINSTTKSLSSSSPKNKKSIISSPLHLPRQRPSSSLSRPHPPRRTSSTSTIASSCSSSRSSLARAVTTTNNTTSSISNSTSSCSSAKKRPPKLRTNTPNRITSAMKRLTLRSKSSAPLSTLMSNDECISDNGLSDEDVGSCPPSPLPSLPPHSQNPSLSSIPQPAWIVDNNLNTIQTDSAVTSTTPSKSSTPINHKTYAFDHAFGPSDTTSSIYNNSVRNVVRSAMDGYHATVFAYGQTSTGKTYTMTGGSLSQQQEIMDDSDNNSINGSINNGGIINDDGDGCDNGTIGIIQHSINDCFDYITNQNQNQREREYLLRVSFMEIYNETIHDLLADDHTMNTPTHRSSSSSSSSRLPPSSSSLSSSTNSIRIFESKTEGVIVRGLKEEIVTSPNQVLQLLKQGESRRRTGSTEMNKGSSRSHSIFRILVESSPAVDSSTNDDDASCVSYTSTATSNTAHTLHSSYPSKSQQRRKSREGASSSTSSKRVRVSSLSLVDLAGSECIKATGATGTRKKEGQYINKSLMTLGHVIYKLSEISAKMEKYNRKNNVVDSDDHLKALTHIPYRDSKLTRLLQPSLSGNAQICIICNISPIAEHLDESINTLNFASRAKKIKQKASVNEAVDDKTLLQNYRDEIDSLKKQLKEVKALVAQPADATATAATLVSAPRLREDEDTCVLVEAIGNLEKLILKTSSAQKKKLKERGKGSRNGGISDDDKTPPMVIMAESILTGSINGNGKDGVKRRDDIDANIGEGSSKFGLDGVLSTPRNSQGKKKNLNNNKDDEENSDDLSAVSSVHSLPQIDYQSTLPGDNSSTTSTEENSVVRGSRLINELHRIQGLLGSVLKRKESKDSKDDKGDNMSAPSSPERPSVRSDNKPFIKQDGQFVLTTPSKINSSDPLKRDVEVERLRAQLHEQAVATSLRKADSSFLQTKLQQKENLLQEVSNILDAVEHRQVELERENAEMKEEWTKTMSVLKKREEDVMRAMALLKEREAEINTLKKKVVSEI